MLHTIRSVLANFCIAWGILMIAALPIQADPPQWQVSACKSCTQNNMNRICKDPSITNFCTGCTGAVIEYLCTPKVFPQDVTCVPSQSHYMNNQNNCNSCNANGQWCCFRNENASKAVYQDHFGNLPNTHTGCATLVGVDGGDPQWTYESCPQNINLNSCPHMGD